MDGGSAPHPENAPRESAADGGASNQLNADRTPTSAGDAAFANEPGHFVNPEGVEARMRQDWNARAREDAGFYVAFGRRNSSDAEFFTTATDVINGLEAELRRVPLGERHGWRALEVGCGPGRLMRPMSRHFVEIYGVDVSDEMIALARQKLADIPNARVTVTGGSDLRVFAEEFFDFVYSYAVFQHIPSRDVIFEYCRETRRVLKDGGLARLQFNGLRGGNDAADTWSGARFSSTDILEFAARNDFQVLALDGIGTQYMWTTWQKRPNGWLDEIDQREARGEGVPDVKIRTITNAFSFEPLAPSRGRFASISIWVENLAPEAGLHHLRVTVGDSLGTVCYVSPRDRTGAQQINVLLPELEATGLLPVEIHWLDRKISPTATVRIIPPGPSIPHLKSVTDGFNQLSRNRIESRIGKMTLEEIERPHEIEVSIDGHAVSDLEFFCMEPRAKLFQVNFRLPEEIGAGEHAMLIKVGRRKLPPVSIEVTLPPAA